MDQCDTLDVTAKMKGDEMPIEINRTEVLSLMQELPQTHFLQSRLVDELIRLNQDPTPVKEVSPPERRLSIAETRDRLEERMGIREVIDGRLTVTPSPARVKRTAAPELGKGEYTAKQLDELYEVGGIAPQKQCKWQTYGYQCRTESRNEFCDEHINETCSHKDAAGVRCGHKADHGCPTELQFVCGAPCCAEHSNCGNHNYTIGRR